MSCWFDTSPLSTKIGPMTASTARCSSPGTGSMSITVRSIVASAIGSSMPATSARIAAVSSGFSRAHARARS